MLITCVFAECFKAITKCKHFTDNSNVSLNFAVLDNKNKLYLQGVGLNIISPTNIFKYGYSQSLQSLGKQSSR